MNYHNEVAEERGPSRNKRPQGLNGLLKNSVRAVSECNRFFANWRITRTSPSPVELSAIAYESNPCAFRAYGRDWRNAYAIYRAPLWLDVRDSHASRRFDLLVVSHGVSWPEINSLAGWWVSLEQMTFG